MNKIVVKLILLQLNLIVVHSCFRKYNALEILDSMMLFPFHYYHTSIDLLKQFIPDTFYPKALTAKSIISSSMYMAGE